MNLSLRLANDRETGSATVTDSWSILKADTSFGEPNQKKKRFSSTTGPKRNVY